MIDGILRCELFRQLTETHIRRLLEEIPLTKAVFHEGEIIYQEGQVCDSLAIINLGQVDISHLLSSGKEIRLALLEAGDVFGEALLFGDNSKVPITLSAAETTEVYFIHRTSLHDLLMQERLISQNFLSLLSHKIFLLNERVRLLGLDSIRKKVVWYLLQQTEGEAITVPFNREGMARHLAVPRPSLSRELAKLKEDGLIDYQGRQFKLLSRVGLEAELSE